MPDPIPELLDDVLKVTDKAIKGLNELNGCGCGQDHEYEQVFKATVKTPNFKVDPSSGEGKPTPEEISYRQDLKDLIKQVWDKRDKLDDIALYDFIDKLFFNDKSTGKQLATDFITTIYNDNMLSMQKKLLKLKIKKKIPDQSDILDALLDWQCFAIEKMGIELYYGIVNQRKGKAYFEAAYNGGKAKA